MDPLFAHMPHDGEVLRRINVLGEGSFSCGRSNGWLTLTPVEDNAEGWVVHWTNGQHKHQPLNGPAYIADFYPRYATLVCKSAYRYHAIEDDQKRAEAVAYLIKRVTQAHETYALKDEAQVAATAILPDRLAGVWPRLMKGIKGQVGSIINMRKG